MIRVSGPGTAQLIDIVQEQYALDIILPEICFRTRISALYPFLDSKGFLKQPASSCKSVLYFVRTSPDSDVRRSSVIPDIPAETWAKFPVS